MEIGAPKERRLLTQEMRMQHGLGRPRDQKEGFVFREFVVHPFLENAGKRGIPLDPVRKFVEDDQARPFFSGKERKEFYPAFGNHTFEDREMGLKLLGQVENLLLGCSLNGLMIQPPPLLTDFPQKSRFSHTTASRD